MLDYRIKSNARIYTSNELPTFVIVRPIPVPNPSAVEKSSKDFMDKVTIMTANFTVIKE